MKSSEAESIDLPRIASDLAGRKVEGISPAASGRNSRIFRIEAGSEVYALKCYPHTPGDTRQRHEAERAALQFFARNGIANVPRWVEYAPGYALLSWVEGEIAMPPEDAEIAQAVSFIAAIKEHAGDPAARAIAPASESCLCPADIQAQISRRFEALHKEPALADFLEKRFSPLWKAAWENACEAYKTRGLAPDTPLVKGKALSPADFGFHNALRGQNGALTFIDFEYFGWDDPARLSAEFCLHPGMQLSQTQKEDFTARMETLFREDPDFTFRRDTLRPLFALRWALIMLNSFLPQYRQARAPEEGWEAVKDRQLAKAAKMLENALVKER